MGIVSDVKSPAPDPQLHDVFGLGRGLLLLIQTFSSELPGFGSIGNCARKAASPARVMRYVPVQAPSSTQPFAIIFRGGQPLIWINELVCHETQMGTQTRQLIAVDTALERPWWATGSRCNESFFNCRTAVCSNGVGDDSGLAAGDTARRWS